jgi:hypothetical protein
MRILAAEEGTTLQALLGARFGTCAIAHAPTKPLRQRHQGVLALETELVYYFCRKEA